MQNVDQNDTETWSLFHQVRAVGAKLKEAEEKCGNDSNSLRSAEAIYDKHKRWLLIQLRSKQILERQLEN